LLRTLLELAILDGRYEWGLQTVEVTIGTGELRQAAGLYAQLEDGKRDIKKPELFHHSPDHLTLEPNILSPAKFEEVRLEESEAAL
jgi:hypothetical protein